MSSTNPERNNTNLSPSQTELTKIGPKFLLLVILLANFMRGFGTNVISIGLPNHIIVLGGTLASYGIVLGIFQIFQALFQLPTSLFSDKFGRRKLILIGMSVYIIGTILCGLAQTITQLIIFRILQGTGAFSSVLMAVIGDILAGEAKKRAISLYFFSLTAGFLFGTLFGGIFTALIGVEGTFFLCAGLTFLSFLLLLIFLPETAPMKSKKDPVEGEIRTTKGSWKENMKFLRSRGFYGGTIAMVLKSGIMSGVIAYTTWVLSIYYDFSDINLSLVLLPLIIVYTLGLLLAPKVAKKVGTIRLISLSFIVNGILFGILVLVSPLEIYLSLSFIVFFFFGLLDPTITNYTLSFIPAPSRGLGTGVYQTWLFLAMAFGQIFILKIGDLTNFQITYLVSASLCLLACTIIGLLKREKKA